MGPCQRVRGLRNCCSINNGVLGHVPTMFSYLVWVLEAECSLNLSPGALSASGAGDF